MKRSVRVVRSVRRVPRHLGNAPKVEKTKRGDGNLEDDSQATSAGSTGRINGTGSMKQHARVLVLCMREDVKHLLPPTTVSQNVSLSSSCQHCHSISFLVWPTWCVSKYLRWVHPILQPANGFSLVRACLRSLSLSQSAIAPSRLLGYSDFILTENFISPFVIASTTGTVFGPDTENMSGFRNLFISLPNWIKDTREISFFIRNND